MHIFARFDINLRRQDVLVWHKPPKKKESKSHFEILHNYGLDTVALQSKLYARGSSKWKQI